MRHLLFSLFCLSSSMYGQSLGTAGTIRGKITDPSGAVVAGATVTLSNDLTLYRREATTRLLARFSSRISLRTSTTSKSMPPDSSITTMI